MEREMVKKKGEITFKGLLVVLVVIIFFIIILMAVSGILTRGLSLG